MRFGGAEHWGPGVPRYRTSASNWAQPLKWNRQQGIVLQAWKDALERNGGDESRANAGGMCKPEPWRVFCASLADVFDNEVPAEWRHDLFNLIGQTPNLEWLLVTKRIGNAARMIEDSMGAQKTWPIHWATNNGVIPNVRILITVVNQEEADRDIPKLLALPCKNGISYEPALGPIDFSVIPHGGTEYDRSLGGQERVKSYWLDALTGTRGVLMKNGDVLEAGEPGSHLEWVIVGGESTQGGGKARPFNIEWARSTVKQCKGSRVPVFAKQLGSMPYDGTQQSCDANECMVHGCSRLALKDRAGADPEEWPEDLRVREFPV